MKRKLFFVALLTLLLPQLLSYSYTRSYDDCCVNQVQLTGYQQASNGYVNVNVSEAKQMIESNPDLVILDVRTQGEYDEGHIEDAVLIPVSELEERIDELDKNKEILVYCKSGVRSATASQILVDNGFVSVYNMLGGITAWRNAGYWIEIIHRGDLVVDGTQTYVIENCTYIQEGSVHIKDYGKLVIRNSEFQMSQSRHWEYEFTVEDYGAFEMENAVVASNYALSFSFLRYSKARLNNVTCLLSNFYHIFFTDYSKASIDRLTLHGCHGIELAGQCDVSIERSIIDQLGITAEGTTTKICDSRIGQFNIGFAPEIVVNVIDLKPGFYEYLDSQEQIKIYGGSLRLFLNKTRVDRWGFGVNYNHKMTILNSTIGRLIIGVEGLSVALENLRHQYYTHKRVGGITLNGTRIMESGDAWTIIIDSPPGTQSNIVTITNSTVLLHPRNNSTVCLSNTIAGWGFDCFFGTLGFESTAWTDSWIFNSNFFMYGNITFREDISLVWYLSNVTRNYGAIVLDAYGNLASDVTLTLGRKDGMLLWNGTTDGLGRADFNLTFTDSNYTDTLKLKAVKGNYSATMNVSFLSDTPVILTMRYFADLNGDGTVNIMDIAMVAKAYGTKQGDPNWDPIADVAEPYGEINILDIATVAKDYGKTT